VGPCWGPLGAAWGGDGAGAVQGQRGLQRRSRAVEAIQAERVSEPTPRRASPPLSAPPAATSAPGSTGARWRITRCRPTCAPRRGRRPRRLATARCAAPTRCWRRRRARSCSRHRWVGGRRRGITCCAPCPPPRSSCAAALTQRRRGSDRPLPPPPPTPHPHQPPPRAGPQAPHISLALAGVEIISNGSGSHHQLRKLDTRLDLICSATAKAGGVYLYANQQARRAGGRGRGRREAGGGAGGEKGHHVRAACAACALQARCDHAV
jgi:hypothetical protein